MSKNKITLRKYCLIGMDNIDEIKEDLEFISDSVANFATGENLIIATFGSALNIIEIEEFLNMNERAFIIFEMLPATFSANLILEKFQKTLFGGKIDNSEFIGLFNVRNNMEHTMKKFSGDNMEGILEELHTNIKNTEEAILIEPTVDEILDKITDKGIDKLTNKEKEILKKQSNKNDK